MAFYGNHFQSAAVSYAQPVSTYAQPAMSYRQPSMSIAQPARIMQAQPQRIMQAQPQYVTAQPQYTAAPQAHYVAEPQYIHAAQPAYAQPQYTTQYAEPQSEYPSTQGVKQIIQPKMARGGLGTGGQAIPDGKEEVPMTGNVHMLCCGIDYACDHQSWAGPPPNGHGPLDTKYAFDFMVQLAEQCGVTSLTQLFNEQCTKENIYNTIIEVGQRCGPGDTFVFYYTGHGDQLPNSEDRMNEDPNDQCLCTVDAAGNTDDATMRYREQVWMRDDAIAEAIQTSVMAEARSLVLVDACHSGSICDFSTNSKWNEKGMKAISISGCQDDQTSAGTGKGGVYTRALTLAIEEMQQVHGHNSFNVSCIYNAVLQKYQETNPPGHEQNISIHGCGMVPQDFPWPLQPKGQYESPAWPESHHVQHHAPLSVSQNLQPMGMTYTVGATYPAPSARYTSPVQYAPRATSMSTVNYSAPQRTYAAPVTQTYAAPSYGARTFAAPATTYSRPAQTYAAAASFQTQTYAAPASFQTYAAPSASYGASYGTSSPGMLGTYGKTMAGSSFY